MVCFVRPHSFDAVLFCYSLVFKCRILSEQGMQFSPEQDQALKAVGKWLKEGRSPIFRLFGYAGTGKTTLARYFAEHVDGDVQFAAFTGKAAQVLRPRAQTMRARCIH